MARDSYVRVAPDSTGKYIRNVTLWLPIDLLDGAGPLAVQVQQQIVGVADPLSGKVVETDTVPVLEEILAALHKQCTMLAHLTDSDVSLGADSLPIGVLAQAARGLTTRAEPGHTIQQMADPFGRLVTMPWGARDMYGVGFSGTITDTSAHALVPAQADAYADLVALLIANTSASTNARADVSDGTNVYPFQTIGGAPTSGFSGGGFLLPAASKNTAWTITMSAAVTDIRAWAVFVKNK